MVACVIGVDQNWYIKRFEISTSFTFFVTHLVNFSLSTTTMKALTYINMDILDVRATYKIINLGDDQHIKI